MAVEVSRETITREQLVTLIPDAIATGNQEFWQQTSLAGFEASQPQPKRYGYADVMVFEPPSGSDIDTSNTTVLILEHLQPASLGNSIRAESIRRQVNPKGRLLLIPQSTPNHPHVDLSILSYYERKRLAQGRQTIYGGLIMNSLEKADSDLGLGDIQVFGSSQGACLALGMVAFGSDKFNITRLGLFEPPSKQNRGFSGLFRDLTKSGTDIKGAVKASENAVQAEALQTVNLPLNFVRFVGATTLNSDARMLALSLRGDINQLLGQAVDQLPDSSVSIYHIEHSRIFDPVSITKSKNKASRIVSVSGEGLFGHVSSSDMKLMGGLSRDSLVVV